MSKKILVCEEELKPINVFIEILHNISGTSIENKNTYDKRTAKSFESENLSAEELGKSAANINVKIPEVAEKTLTIATFSTANAS